MRCPPQGVAKPAIDGGVHHLKMLDIEAGRADGSETGIADGLLRNVGRHSGR